VNAAAARLAAGRLFLSELDRLASAREDFAFESTLSGLGYLPRLRRWQRAGYRIEIIYLELTDVRLSLERIVARVRAGGHDVPEPDARRRFTRSWTNLLRHYQPLTDASWIFDVSGAILILLHETP
jgi:predicted ABC-type ATPase